jgi:hypothetical protein
MKVIQFKINDVAGRVHVVTLQQVVPMLKRQALLHRGDQLLIDWAGDGNFKEAWHEQVYLLCPVCLDPIILGIEDLDDMVECGECESEVEVPATREAIEAANAETLTVRSTEPTHETWRVMLDGEDHTESCLHNGISDELIDLVVAGYQVNFPEGRVYKEPEETYNDMIRNRDWYDIEER